MTNNIRLEYTSTAGFNKILDYYANNIYLGYKTEKVYKQKTIARKIIEFYSKRAYADITIPIIYEANQGTSADGGGTLRAYEWHLIEFLRAPIKKATLTYTVFSGNAKYRWNSVWDGSFYCVLDGEHEEEKIIQANMIDARIYKFTLLQQNADF